MSASNTSIEEIVLGTVYKKSQGHYVVRAKDHLLDCEVSSRLRKQLVYPVAAPTSLAHRVRSVEKIRVVDPVAVGDIVRIIPAGEDAGVIIEVRPRKNQVARRDPGPRPIEQVIAANVDHMVIVIAAAQPAPRWELVDRYLAATELAEIPPIVVLTKTDLAGNSFVRQVEEYRSIGYPVFLTSAVEHSGLEELRSALYQKLSVFVGMSGVGKSTLLNALEPGLSLPTNQISRVSGKGKHTTSHLELFDLQFGGRIIDTPGLKYLTLWELEGAEVASCFVEMRPYLGRCKFGADCTHDHEPHCAVKDAVKAGAISPRRYASYLHIKG